MERMKRMSRNEWADLVARRQDRLGGDLWNEHQIWAKAFRQYPDAVRASYDYIGTGLWVDVTLTLADGQTIERRILG